jgi:predicted transcriptional regulator YheO
MMHMAETPSQVKTADEEKVELRGMIDYLSEELTTSLGSQSLTLVSRAAGIVREIENLSKTTEGLAEEAEKVSQEVEESLTAPKPKALAARIVRARESLKAEGSKVTVDAVCKSLGISQATYYRYKSPEQSTEALLPLSI